MTAAPSDALPSPRRGVVLSLIVVVSVAFFVLTHFVNGAYQRERAALARHWLQAGDAEFAAGQTGAAIEAYRAALVYNSEDAGVTLKLAEALARESQTAGPEQATAERQASAYLLTLLQQQPGNGPVNLALARLSARQQDAAGATRYYHGAIFGGWSGQGQAMRREARLELVDFLLARGATTDARAELIAMTADLPRDPQVVASVAERFTRAGDDANALRLYRQAIELNGATPAVLSGAGMSAFRLADYRSAVEYLEQAKKAGADSNVATTLETARTVLELDPFARRLPTAQRIARLERLLAVAAARVEACQPPAAPNAIAPQAAGVVSQLGLAQQIDVAQQQLHRAREMDPDLTDGVMRLVLEAEQSRPNCAAPSPQDEAASLIARAREASER